MITCDARCELTFDGASLGVLAAGTPRTIEASTGEHVLEATSLEEPTTRSRKLLSVAGSGSREVTIRLAERVGEVLAARCRDQPENCFLQVESDILIDPRHDLAWSRRSMGSDRDWTAAVDICRSSTLGGFSDWRLPTIEELETLTRRDLPRVPCGAARCQSYPQFELRRPWIWSSNRSDPETAWHFLFDLGLRHSVPIGLTEQTGTLCTRRSNR